MAASTGLAGVQEGVEVVGHILVVEGGGVGVVAERCGGVTMTKAGRGFEELALVDEVGGHAVAQAVKRRLVDAGGPPETGETVAQGAGGQVGDPLRAWREQPVRPSCGTEPLPGAEVRADE